MYDTPQIDSCSKERSRDIYLFNHALQSQNKNKKIECIKTQMHIIRFQ